MNPLALVAENDAGTRRLLDVLLSRIGLQVDLVASGSDALLLLEHVPYDVRFLELLLPGASGFEILERLASRGPENVENSVVVSSAPPTDLDRVRRTWPAVQVVRKPFELSEILGIAERAASSPARQPLTTFEEFCRRSILAGAKSSVVVELRGSDVVPVTSYGYKPGEIEAFLPLSLQASVPICASMRNAVPVWIAALSRAADDYPALVHAWQRHESRALAVVPLLRDGVVIGAVGWSFREPRLFNEPEQQAFLSIAQTLLELPEFHARDESQSRPA